MEFVDDITPSVSRDMGGTIDVVSVQEVMDKDSETPDHDQQWQVCIILPTLGDSS